MKFEHTPVLLDETLLGLNLTDGKTVIDATVGGGGHSEEIAKRIGNGKLICIDQDAEAIEHVRGKIPKAAHVHGNFRNIADILDKLNIEKADAILADLGVSSYQIDNPERGFSYTRDAALDMRMDRTKARTAHHVVNNYKPERLRHIIEEYGEERYAGRITDAIVAARPVNTTQELAKIIQDAVPGNYFRTGGHPAKRTFQAIRIEVNGELEIIEDFINAGVQRLNRGGRIAIITFHSLEDRIVKQTFRELATDCICPPKTPKCICNHHASLKIINKKPIEATKQEIENNPRCASAKLRIAEKI